MYADGFGSRFDEKAAAVSCRDFIRYLPNQKDKNFCLRQQGKILQRVGNRLKIKKSDGVSGVQCRVRRRVVSPESERRIRVTHEDFEEIDANKIESALTPIYPSWNRQHEGIMGRIECPESRINEFHDELKGEWLEWGKRCVGDYFLNKLDQYPQFRGIPPWRGVLEKNSNRVAQRLRVAARIASDFHSKHRPSAILDCATFFETEQNIDDFSKELAEFVKHSRQVLVVEWPLAVGRIMLDEGDHWIPRVVDGSCKEDFDGVAATMSRLLYDVLAENIRNLQKLFNQGSSCLLRVTVDSENEVFSLLSTAKCLYSLAKIPRVEHLLYPSHFPASQIDVSNWLFAEHDAICPLLPHDFGAIETRLDEVLAQLEEYEKSPENIRLWNQIATKVERISQDAKDLHCGFRVPPILYDRSSVKKRVLQKILETETRLKRNILAWQAEENRTSHTLFAEWSKRLCDADVVGQLRCVGELQAQRPLLRKRVAAAHDVYGTYLKHFCIPDTDLRDYWEISRLPKRLDSLADCVWQRVEQQREWITRRVSERTSANYFEAEAVERELETALRKYRHGTRVPEIQRVATKIGQLVVRGQTLLSGETELIGQRELLGLPEFTVDLAEMVSTADFFAALAQFHCSTMKQEEEVMKARVMDLQHGDVAESTEKLMKQMEVLKVKSANISERHRGLSEQVLAKTTELLEKVARLLPVISAVHNQGMKERHWEEVLKEMEEGTNLRGNPLVGELLEMNITEKAEKLEEISALAQKEMQLEQSVAGMRKQWSEATFHIRHKGELLSSELSAQMAAHIAKSQQILTSPYATTVLEQLREWLDTLLQLYTFVQLYTECEKSWNRVEGVFSTEDVAYQMPAEFRVFKKIALLWQQVNNRISEELPIIEQLAAISEENRLLLELREDFVVLERGFHSYLRKKRLVFPRLHLLDDAALLHLLSLSRQPIAVNRMIRLLFPHISSLLFNKRGEVSEVELTGHVRFPLSKPVNVAVSKRHVEKWLSELDRELRTAVRLKLKALLSEHSLDLIPITKLIEEEPHIAVIFFRITATQFIEDGIGNGSLREVSDLFNRRLIEGTEALEKESRRHRLEPLLLLLHHYCAIIKRLMTSQVSFIEDVSWTSTVRFYWNLDHVFVRVHGLSVRHDYDIATPLSFPQSEKTFGIILSWNHYSVPISTENMVDVAVSTSRFLGKSLLFLRGSEEEIRLTSEGALWMGTVTISESGHIWNRLLGDIQKNLFCGSQKILFDKSEIPINSSLFPISKHTGKRVHFQENLSSYIEDVLFVSGFRESERLKNRIHCFLIVFPLLFDVKIAESILMEDVCRESIRLRKEHGSKEVQAVDTAIQNVLGAHIFDQDFSSFASLLPSALVNKSSDRKLHEFIRIISTRRSVIVCGETLCGKTRLILKASKLLGISLITEKDMEDPDKEIPDNCWLVYNGLNDKVNRLLDSERPAMMYPSSSSQFPDNVKIILECDTVPDCLKEGVPILRVESPSNEWPADLSLPQVVKLESICRDYCNNICTRLFRDRVSRLCENLGTSDEVLEHIVWAVLCSLNLEFSKAIDNPERLMDSFPGFEEKPKFYWGMWIERLFSLGFIPLVPSSHGYSSLLDPLIQYLDEKGFGCVDLNLNASKTKEEVENILSRCELLFGGESSVVFFLRDFHLSPDFLQEYLRTSPRPSPRHFIIFSSQQLSSYTPRLQRFLFSVPSPISENYPMVTYSKTIATITKDIRVKDVRDAVKAEFGKSLEEVAKFSEKYASVKIELEKEIRAMHKLVYGKGLYEPSELSSIYRKQISEQRKGVVWADEPVVTENEAIRLCLLEKVFRCEGAHVLSCCETNSRDSSLTWIKVVAEILDFDLMELDQSGSVVDFLNMVLRKSLLEERRVLLVTDGHRKEVLPFLHTLFVSKCIPSPCLSQQFMTEFGEKHTIEGRGMWRRLSSLIQFSLRGCTLIDQSRIMEFYQTNTELCEVSILDWCTPRSPRCVSSAVNRIIDEAGVLSSAEKMEILDKMEKLKLEERDDRDELTRLFVHIARARKAAIDATMARYEKGMEKLRLAEGQTASLQAELSRLRPELLRTSIETSVLMSTIERETIEVENAREVVAANEHKANQAATAAQALRAESEADLANAIPALEASIEALETLNQSDVSTLKTMRFPPYGVRLCMEAVCILLGQRPLKVPNQEGGMSNDYWPTGLKLLSDLHFLSRIRNFPRDSVSRRTMLIIRERYLSKPEFDPEHIKQCSLAAEGLCLWVKAVEFYHRISKVVEPKKEKLRKAEMLVKQHMKQLEVKRKVLQKVTEKLQQLSDQFGQMSQRKQDLQTQISTCEMRIERAERLVAALGGEKDKWLHKMDMIREDLNHLPHQCLLAAVSLYRESHLTQQERKKKSREREQQLFPSEESNETPVDDESLIHMCSLPFYFYNDYGRGFRLVSRIFPSVKRVSSFDQSVLTTALAEGSVLFVDSPWSWTETVKGLRFFQKDEKQMVRFGKEDIEVTPGFRIFLSTSSEFDKNESWSFVTLNMEYSEEELREEISVSFGKQNWAEEQEARDLARDAVRADAARLDEMETEMLELLGKKEEELDDEGAVDLLAETNEVGERLAEKSRQLQAAELRLSETVDQFRPLIKWTASAIQFIRRFRSFSHFYDADIEKLIHLTDMRLNTKDILMEDVPSLWHKFWNHSSISIGPQHRFILHYGLRNLHKEKMPVGKHDISKAMKEWEEPKQMSLLTKVIMTTNCRTPILIALTEPRGDFATCIHDAAKGTTPVQFTSFIDCAILNVERMSETATWLILTLDEWEELDNAGMGTLVESLTESKKIHSSFRLLIVMKSLEGATTSSLRFPVRLCFSSQSSLRSLIRHTISLRSFRESYASITPFQQTLFLKLIVIFHCYRSRWPQFDDVDLKVSLRLFLDINVEEDKYVEAISVRVISPVLLSQLKNSVDEETAKAIYRWIFEGLNKPDDALLRPIFGSDLDEERLLERLGRCGESVVTGEHQERTQKRIRKEENRILTLLQQLTKKSIITKVVDETPHKQALKITKEVRSEGFSWRNVIVEEMNEEPVSELRINYLKSLLTMKEVVQIEVVYIRKPQRIVALLRAMVAVGNKISVDEVTVSGSLAAPVSTSGKRVTLIGCEVVGANIVNGELQEQISDHPQKANIFIEAKVKPGNPAPGKQEKFLPLVDQDGNEICQITVGSPVPMSHWSLRGAHFRTS